MGPWEAGADRQQLSFRQRNQQLFLILQNKQNTLRVSCLNQQSTVYGAEIAEVADMTEIVNNGLVEYELEYSH